MNVNGYDPQQFIDKLPMTKYYDKIKELERANFKLSYERTYDGKHFTGHLVTPREYYYYPRLTLCSLYYIDHLAETNPDKIVDIGCGMNIWKQFYPNISGIDPSHPSADIVDLFNEDFVERNKDTFESAFTIGGLIFSSLINLEHLMQMFIGVIKPGGRGYMSFNIARMCGHYTTKEDYQKIFDKTSPSTEEISMYCDSIITKLPVKLLVVDNLILERYNDYMDGNLRIVFEKS